MIVQGRIGGRDSSRPERLSASAWVERDAAPPLSTAYTIRNGQVIAAAQAADRHGLQPVMNLTANGASRAMVKANQTVNLAAKLEMPPKTGQIVHYNWAINGTDDPATLVKRPEPLVKVNRAMTFDKSGTYTIRLTVNGQRDGLANPSDGTPVRNFKEVRVVVQWACVAPSPPRAPRKQRWGINGIFQAPCSSTSMAALPAIRTCQKDAVTPVAK
jgi:hypothetical protein